MSQREEGSKVFLADTDLFFFYLQGGRLNPQSKNVIDKAGSGDLELRTSSEVYDDAISALRADNVPLSLIHSFVSDMRSVPHKALPMSAEIAEEALKMYMELGGRRKLSYFDSFHVATAKRFSIALLTSDSYIIHHAKSLELSVVDLSDFVAISNNSGNNNLGSVNSSVAKRP